MDLWHNIQTDRVHMQHTFIRTSIHSFETSDCTLLTIREQHRADFVATRLLNHYRELFSFLCSKFLHFPCHTVRVLHHQIKILLHPNPHHTPNRIPIFYGFLKLTIQVLVYKSIQRRKSNTHLNLILLQSRQGKWLKLWV